MGAGWLAQPLLDFAQRGFDRINQPTFAPKTIIVLMGNGTNRTRDHKLEPKFDGIVRIEATASLYKQCKATGASCRVIVTGGDPQRHGQAEADNYAPYLLADGVDRPDLALENQSLNTYQNARNVSSMIETGDDTTLIVVTSSYHMKRTMLAFEAFGLKPQPAVADVLSVRRTFLPHMNGILIADVATHEIVGVARFHVYRWLHLY
jgi:uncharacterized SAM-binding protein YcdF (DUF218 family)